ncbi:MAG: response regulator transcription factor [Dehalococcoidia bacterium]|nr:response regulator transcription factor [Dehalococcoidia bacterium]
MLIVEDQLMVRRALRLAFRAFDDIEVVGEAVDGPEALEACGQLLPDLVLLDLILPTTNGAQVTHLLKQRHPEVHILGLTSFVDSPLVTEMLRAGAADCLQKTVTPSEMVAAIRRGVGRPAQSHPQIEDVCKIASWMSSLQRGRWVGEWECTRAAALCRGCGGVPQREFFPLFLGLGVEVHAAGS